MKPWFSVVATLGLSHTRGRPGSLGVFFPRLDRIYECELCCHESVKVIFGNAVRDRPCPPSKHHGPLSNLRAPLTLQSVNAPVVMSNGPSECFKELTDFF